MRTWTKTWLAVYVCWLVNWRTVTWARLLTNTGELDDLLECTQRCNNIPALGFALTSLNHDSKASFSKDLLYARAYGTRNGPRDVLPTNRTLFCVGSITKHFTATLVLHLIDLLQKRGFNYSISSLITDILPHLKFPSSKLNDLTIEDILSHRTGLAETFGPFWFGNHKNITRTKLAEMTAHLPRVQRNREGYHYNNLVFSIAGLVAESLGEKFINATVPWELLLQEFLFHSLGISSSVGYADTIDLRRVAKPFLSINGKLQPLDSNIMQLISPAGPSGSLCVSPAAMSTWLYFLLKRGVHAGVQIVSSETIENSWKSRIVQNSELPSDAVRGGEGMIANIRRGYALGWGTGTYRGFDYVGHGGGFYSYVSLLTVFPQVNISIFTAASGPATPAIKSVIRTLHLNVFDRLMGFRAVNHRFCEKTQPRVDTPRGIAKTIQRDLYTGLYSHSLFGYLTVTTYNHQLHLLIGKYGNASIHCWTSTTVCELKFHGILWWISDSDAFYNDRDTNRTVIFQLCRGRMWRLILPLYSSAVPPVFVWNPPTGSDDWLYCAGQHQYLLERDESYDVSASASLQLARSSAVSLEIEYISGLSIFVGLVARLSSSLG